MGYSNEMYRLEVSPRARPPHGTFTPPFPHRVLSIIIFLSPLSPSFHHLFFLPHSLLPTVVPSGWPRVIFTQVTSPH